MRLVRKVPGGLQVSWRVRVGARVSSASSRDDLVRVRVRVRVRVSGAHLMTSAPMHMAKKERVIEFISFSVSAALG